MKRSALLSLIICIAACGVGLGQTTQFTYQGLLQNGGTAASGNYDFEFLLYDALSGGDQLGSTLTRNSVMVPAGTFSVDLDFGSQLPGANRFLEIRVRQTGQPTLITLAPRQQISSNPYSVKSLTANTATSATSADSAVNAMNAVTAATATNAFQLGGVAANQYVQTNGNGFGLTNLNASNISSGTLNNARLGVIPVANGGTGSATQNFVDLTNAQTIGGNKTFSNTLSGNIVNAVTQFNIGGSRMLSNAGSNNVFAGSSAGIVNTGSVNAFFGAGTGEQNTTGNENSFFGFQAGFSNQTSCCNSFFGRSAGELTTMGTYNSFVGSGSGSLNTVGHYNSFFGVLAGDTNTTGSKNTIVGHNADVATNNLSYATAIGADASVSSSNTVILGRNLDTVQIPGNLNISGNFTGNLPAGNANYIQNIPGIGTQAASFNITGGGTANIFNAATQFNIGGNRVLSNAGQGNLFAGRDSGISNGPDGVENAFFGAKSGQSFFLGVGNSFFGFSAGQSTVASISNSFFGYFSGQATLNGGFNSFFGAHSGRDNIGGEQNSYFSFRAGFANTFGSQNAFFGMNAGNFNTEGSSNSYFGFEAGALNLSGSNNTAIGYGASVGESDLSNATALGALATVSQSNSLVLGNNAKVGIGTGAPAFKLHVLDTSNTGLRVETGLAGGTVASFGGIGSFSVDAPFIPGGRLSIKENGNVGVGISNPTAKLHVAGGNIYIANPSSLIITSPNGACWSITVNNAGSLSTTSVACP